MSDDKPQHSGGFSGSISAARAGIVLVAFVVCVAILVAVGTRPTVSAPTSSAQTTVPPGATTTTTAAAAAGAGSTTTTTTHPATTTTHPATTTTHSTTATTHAGHRHGAGTTTTTVAPHTVSVVVANATNTSGLAAHYTTVIGAGGWAMQTPTNATSSETTSTVYYAAGMQQPAAAIASSIGVKPAQVQLISTATPVQSATGMDVVVIIGQDLASAAGT